MSKPIVALIGKPNVGKSTFFNYIIGERLSIVEDTPGVTRDRIYGEANWRGINFTLVDTGGMEENSSDIINEQINIQANIAIEIADLILFITDIREGITNTDMDIALRLKKSKKPVIVVCNKADDYNKFKNDIYEFYKLGLGDPIAISAENAKGIGDLLDIIVDSLPKQEKNEYEDERIRVAVIRKTQRRKIFINKQNTW